MQEKNMTHPRELTKRLGISGALIALLFLVYFLYGASGPARSHWEYFAGIYVILACVAAYQVLRLIALIASTGRNPSPLLLSLHLRGVRGTLWEIYRRRLLSSARLHLILASWVLLIFALVWILASTRSLEDAEARVIGALTGGNDATPMCRVVMLMTPDNNLQRYYRTLTTLADEFRSAGAALVMAEMARFDANIPDTLRRSGILLYEEGETKHSPLPTAPTGEWRQARLVDQSRTMPERDPALVAFQPVPSWYSGKELHPALQAIARLRNEPNVLEPFPHEGEVRYGSLRIPVTPDGIAFAPSNGGTRKPPGVMLFLKEANDTIYSIEDWRPAFAAPAGSRATWARGTIVLIRWIDNGGLVEWWRGAKLFSLPSVVEALQRGRTITPGGNWHFLLTAVLLLLGAGLSMGKHLRIVPAVLGAVALFLLGADAWLFASQSVLGYLIYPALGSLLAGTFLPLAAHFHRHP